MYEDLLLTSHHTLAWTVGEELAIGNTCLPANILVWGHSGIWADAEHLFHPAPLLCPSAVAEIEQQEGNASTARQDGSASPSPSLLFWRCTNCNWQLICVNSSSSLFKCWATKEIHPNRPCVETRAHRRSSRPDCGTAVKPRHKSPLWLEPWWPVAPHLEPGY